MVFHYSFPKIMSVNISYLSCLINTSLVAGIFPKDWKHAIVLTLLKIGDISGVYNYILNALLPLIANILEKKTLLFYYLERNKLITITQHCFPLNHQLL